MANELITDHRGTFKRVGNTNMYQYELPNGSVICLTEVQLRTFDPNTVMMTEGSGGDEILLG